MISGKATLLLLGLLLLTVLTQQYSVSPSLPPTAFVDQYYSCAFRVGGLSKPRFSFSRLPPPLVGSRSGIVQGIPSASGAYRVTVSFSEEEEEGSEEVMFIVAIPEYNTTEIRSRNLTSPVPWVPGYLQTVYQYGSVIDLNLAKLAGNNQYNWTYLHLPGQLHGDSSGRINGVIKQTGYFTFAAICADEQGNTIDQFITINVQPLSYDQGTTYTVPVQNMFPYDLALVDAIDRDASENAALKLKTYRDATDQLDRGRKNLRICGSNQEKARTQGEIVAQLVKLATKQVAKQLQTANSASNRLKDADGVFQIKKAAFRQAENITKSAQQQFDSANATFTTAKQVLSSSSSQFITAQTQSSQAASNLSSAQLTQQLAVQDINSTFQNVMDAKQLLQTYTATATLLSFNVTSASSEREVASFQNDATTAALNTAESKAKKMMQDLQTAKSEVFLLKDELSSAKSALGQAQFSLTQAMNSLFLAQAAKQQADKQLLLASAQSIQLSTISFAGCNPGNYPSMFGTATIASVGNTTFKLDSGFSILTGGCTSKGSGNYTNGSVVVFEGYLRGGAIHAISLSNG